MKQVIYSSSRMKQVSQYDDDGNIIIKRGKSRKVANRRDRRAVKQQLKNEVYNV